MAINETNGMDEAFVDFHHAYLAEDGALDLKTKEMIALAFAFGNKCQGCIKYHKPKAFEAGMTEEEYRELVAVCEVIAAGGVIMYYGETGGKQSC
jgi:AhpD family alkylhydroperoxidase